MEFLRHRAPDLCAVLLDMAMPKLSGLEVLPLLRRDFPDVPVVLVSGYDESRLASGLADSRLTFLHKPFRSEELRRALDRVLRRAVPA